MERDSMFQFTTVGKDVLMNRFTMAFALGSTSYWFNLACAQKSSAPAMTVSKAQATARDSKTEKLAVKSETKKKRKRR